MRVDGREIVVSGFGGKLVVDGIICQLQFKFLLGQCQIVPERFTDRIVLTSDLLHRIFECICVKINDRDSHEQPHNISIQKSYQLS